MSGYGEWKGVLHVNGAGMNLLSRCKDATPRMNAMIVHRLITVFYRFALHARFSYRYSLAISANKCEGLQNHFLG